LHAQIVRFGDGAFHAPATSLGDGGPAADGEHPFGRDAQEQLHERANAERVQYGADADRPPEQPAEGHHTGFDRRADQPY